MYGRTLNPFVPFFWQLWSDIHTFLYPNTSTPTFDHVWSRIRTYLYPIFENYCQTVTPSNWTPFVPSYYFIWLVILTFSYPHFSNDGRTIHTSLQPTISALAFVHVWSSIRTFFNPLFDNFGRTFTPSCSRPPLLPLLIMYDRAFTAFITCIPAIMVGHSHLLAATHLRSRFWLCMVGHSHLFLPFFGELWLDINTFLQRNTTAPTFHYVWSGICTLFVTRFSVIIVRNSNFLEGEHLPSRFESCMVGHSHLFLPTFH